MSNVSAYRTFDQLPQKQLQQLEIFLNHYFEKRLPMNLNSESLTQKVQSQGYDQLVASVCYSLFSGGKRFRPMVGYLLGEALEIPEPHLTPWLAAVECIHTYSLIHDDLPAMDNDSVRRGKPTNHIVFGETTALLAGDALLTEAFKILGDAYSTSPNLGLSLVRILAHASGLNGMITGQALDLALDKNRNDEATITLIHRLKTGALIQSVAEGIAVLSTGLTRDTQNKVTQFGMLLGFAFQLKDDLLDFDPKMPDTKNLAHHIGLEKTNLLLDSTTQDAIAHLSFLNVNNESPLVQLIQYNRNREL